MRRRDRSDQGDRGDSRRRAQPRQGRRGQQELLVGSHCVAEALRACRRKPNRLLVVPGAERRPEIEQILKDATELGVPIVEVDRERLEVDPGNPQGIGLEAGPLPELTLDSEWLESMTSEGAKSRRIVALDGVEDPQNVGALARVAEGSGAIGLLLADRRAPPLSPALARASAGAIEWLPVIRVTNLVRGINYLKDQGFWIVGADLEAARTLYEMPDELLRGDLVVVLGAEGKGLRREVQKLIDHPVRIPMQGRVGSLNVSAAGAVLLYELLRRAEAAVDSTLAPSK